MAASSLNSQRKKTAPGDGGVSPSASLLMMRSIQGRLPVLETPFA